uniref:2-(3-amino-3-carboxypropyl)histidine synthase subunit 2 n=1 Tax=Geotrypetes seraphini TaxID=260995 RepID=A0A6P8PB68_GEOSA|nr:2-(3-amino-3-carboxypropyl)histidine synthase subunit 2 [Geotrypetes seraphini]XP_033772148.1 2-(3-amino-3-carboxypropyl)histidine synthase subunit 2 [Geotrypetes seraphini]XP_033772149.1 2-(3-amino-3-carboxypropyl)histidine synthase subunit 2 [Geotrypetes seraphini]
MAMQFSSDGEEAIQRPLITTAVGNGLTPPEELDEVYEIERTTAFIAQHQCNKVALQFPDELLVDSATVAKKVEKASGIKVYILGDTSYGSCCVDEVAAEHVGADAVVHYGRACLSPCNRLPVMYVFGHKSVDVKNCAAAFRELYPDLACHVVVVCDVVYHYIMGMLESLLQPDYPHVSFSTITLHGTSTCISRAGDSNSRVTSDEVEVVKFGRRFAIDGRLGIGAYGMFYIGGESPTLTNFMMTWNQCAFSTFNPHTGKGRHETLSVNRALMKRFYLIERARDAKVVGILVGTLGVADYLSVIQHLRDRICRAGKKSYTFVMGKLSTAKLANFLEVDIFVLVACPENSLLDSSDFYRPVVTPYEMDMACNTAWEWTCQYVTDYRDLLPGGCSHVEFSIGDATDREVPDVSLITGELRLAHISQTRTIEDPACTLLAQRSNRTLAERGAAASSLDSRSWKGLERRLGETPVTKAVEGRRGIAIAYEDEVCS